MKLRYTIGCFLLICLVFAGLSVRSSAQSQRLVLAEEATNASCGPCASQNPAFESWLTQNNDRVVPVVYHAWWPGATDTMYTFDKPMQEGRINYYGIGNIGVPAGVLNGLYCTPTGTWYKGAVGDVTAWTNSLSTIPAFSPINITVNFTNNGGVCNLKFNVKSISAFTNKIVRVAICEEQHHYDNAGTNGEKDFYYLARKMLPTQAGVSLSLAANESKDYTYDCTIQADKSTGLYAVVWVQDDVTKEVYQVGTSRSHPQTNLPSVGILPNYFDKAFDIMGTGASSRDFTVFSNSTTAQTYEIFSEKSSRTPSDWSVSTSKTGEIALGANEKVTVTLSLNLGATIGIGDGDFYISPKGSPSNKIYSQMITAMSDGVKSLEVLDGEDAYSLSPITKKYRTVSDYITISSSDYMAFKSKFANVKYLIWNTSGSGTLDANETNALFDLVNNNVGLFVCGGSVTSGLQSNGALPLFGVSFIAYCREGYGSAPWRIWMQGFQNDVISGSFGTNVEGNLISYLTPLYKLTNWPTTRAIVSHMKNGDSIFAVRSQKDYSRVVLFGTNPYVIVNQNKRETLISKILDYIENEPSDVENNTLTGNVELDAFPNPVGNFSNINFTIPGDKPVNVKLTLVNSLGMEVYTLENGTITPGNHTRDLNTQNLPSGNYRLVLNSAAGNQTLPVVIVK